MAVAIATWLLFYIDRIPVASEPAHREKIVADPGSVLIVAGLQSGPLMSINFRAAGRIRLSAGPRARVEVPAAAALAVAPAVEGVGKPPPGRLVIDIFKAATGNAGIDLELRLPAGGHGGVVLEPADPIAGRKGFRISARNGDLALHVLMLPSEAGGSAGEMTLADAQRTVALDEVSLAIPKSSALDIVADDPSGPQAEPIVVELPKPPRSGTGTDRTLSAGAVAAGATEERRFDASFCGARADEEFVLWPLLFPRLTLEHCAVGALTLSAFEPFNGLGFRVSGRAFHRREGKTEMWNAPQIFTSSPIGGKLRDAVIIGPVLGWAGLALRALWKTLRRRV